MVRKFFLLVFLVVFLGASFAQDFGFGFDDYTSEDDSGSAAPSASRLGNKLGLSFKMGGEIALEVTPYIHDFKEKENGQQISFWDMASGSVNYALSGSNVELYTAFNLSYDSFKELGDEGLSNASRTPLLIDEAFLRAYIGPVNIEAGFRKLTWGKADSLGPLDVTNPLDYSDLRNISDIKSIKIARPMLHLTWNTGNFSKLEYVFIPNFAGHRFAQEGRWMASQFSSMPGIFLAGIIEVNPSLGLALASMGPQLASAFSNLFPDTSTLNYFQTGLRYTTTFGSIDIGGQYYYGNLFNPSASLTTDGINAFASSLTGGSPDPGLLNPIKYNRYHQIGIDYAQVLFGFNLRAEFAVNITEDITGDDGSVRNPFIGWSFGFDRELVWGIYANVQFNETIRLMNSKVGSNPAFDCEAGTDATSTRFTMQLSKKFLRDTVESKVSFIWDMENSGFYIIPGLVWTVGGLSADLSAGIFTGKDDGELGQYWENSFIRVGLKYSF